MGCGGVVGVIILSEVFDAAGSNMLIMDFVVFSSRDRDAREHNAVSA